MIPSVTAAMNATPVDRPSRPSIQLMLLIIPTIQKTVSPAAIGPAGNGIVPPPNGLAMKSMLIPSATAAGQRDLAEQLERARRSNRSSMAPRPAATAPPSSSAATSDRARNRWAPGRTRGSG